MMWVPVGSTNVTLYVYFVQDDGGTAPGEPAIGLLFSDIETGGSASYVRQGAARTDFTLITLASASAVHADGGFILVDDVNMPGLYRIDVPDAAFVTGADFVIIQLAAAGANNVLMRPLQVVISNFDFQSTTPPVNVTQLGGVAQSLTDLKDFADDGYDPATNKVQGVVLADTVTANTDMRGTDSAALASVATEARLAELDAANLPTDIAAIQTDTDDIQSRLPAALISGRMSSDAVALSGSTGAADNLQRGAEGLVSSTAAAGSSTTIVNTNLTEVTDDHYNDRVITFTSGALVGQSSSISDYNGTTKALTVVALTEAPGAGDEFVIS